MIEVHRVTALRQGCRAAETVLRGRVAEEAVRRRVRSLVLPIHSRRTVIKDAKYRLMESYLLLS